MDATFDAFLNPRAHTCLGVRLLPLTLGHVRLLQVMESPFICGGQVSLQEVVIGTLICSQPWRQSERDLVRSWMPLVMWLWGRRCRKMTLFDEVAKFREYIEEPFRGLKPVGNPLAKLNAPQVGTPGVIQLQAILMQMFHMTPEEALEQSVIDARCWITAIDEREGHVKLWSQAQEDFWNACHQRDLEKARN